MFLNCTLFETSESNYTHCVTFGKIALTSFYVTQNYFNICNFDDFQDLYTW